MSKKTDSSLFKNKAWAPFVLAMLLVLWQLYVAGIDGQTDGATLIAFGARKPNMGFPQAPWRLAASIFLHSHWLHLLSNLLFLWIWGRQAAKVAGNISFLATFFVGGLAGSILSDIYGPDAVALGASGGAAAILGVVLALAWFDCPERPWQGEASSWLKISLLALVLNGVMSRVIAWNNGDRIDHWAHLGGLLAGLVLGIASSRDKYPQQSTFWKFCLLELFLMAYLLYQRGPTPFD